MTTTMDTQAEQGPTAVRARVKAAADRVEELDEATSLAREQRDLLIVEACEQGCSQRDVARWAGLSQTAVGKILAHH